VDAAPSGAGGGVVMGAVHACRGRLVHTAAARARIRDLEAQGSGGKNDAVALAVRWVVGLGVIGGQDQSLIDGGRDSVCVREVR
jgi:hypothetical protein